MAKKLPYSRRVMSNGLVVLVYPMKGVEAAGLVLKVHAGTFYGEKECGLAHATEHFLFLGTRRFPSERAVNEELESLGATHNGVTDEREIELWVHLPKSNLERGLRLLAQLAFASTISAEQVEKERSVVLQEWRNRHDQPHFRFYQRMREGRLSDPQHVYARDESKRLLESFTRDDVLGFYRRFFRPQQMVLGVGGGMELQRVLRAAEKYFGGEPVGKEIAEPVFATDAYAGFKIIAHEETGFAQANLEVSFPAFGWREKPKEERLAAYMGLRILGGSWVSRLRRILREQRGLVYHVTSGLDLKPWLGTTYVETACAVDRLPEVMGLVRDEVDRYLESGPTEKEVAIEKEYRLGRLATGFEGSLGVGRYFASEEFDGEGILLPKDRMQMIEAVTRKEVWEATKPLFDWGRVQVGLMNDFKGISKEKFEEIAGEVFKVGRESIAQG